MPPPTRRQPTPLGRATRRRRGRSRGSAPVLAVVATVVVVVVAVVCTTGVELGRRLAPSRSDQPTAEGGPRSTRSGRDASEARGGGGPGGSLPDRVDAGAGRGPSTSTPPPSSSSSDGTSPTSGPSSSTDHDEDAPYLGVWPYATWDEVGQHIDGPDGRFATPEDTALRFAGDVVGLHDARVDRTSSADDAATVQLATAGGVTEVRLVRAAPAGRALEDAPWSVVAAVSGVSVDAPAVAADDALALTVRGAASGVVGLHDRTGWRGVVVADRGAAQLRIDPGAAGPALLVAFGGDPRDPSSFSTRRIELPAGVGVRPAAAPADPLPAVHALATAASRGDVGATWELLSEAARSDVLDWRGLAGRLPALRQRLGGLAGPVLTTAVATSAGPVTVVAPQPAPSGATPADALVLSTAGGAARLSTLDAASVEWLSTGGTDPSVVAIGPSRPAALLVDGAVWSAAPEGGAGLRAPIGDLAPGVHLAVALVVDGPRVRASAWLFDVVAALDDGDPSDPDVAQPDGAEPGVAESGTAEPDGAEPGVAESGTAEPKASGDGATDAGPSTTDVDASS